MRGEKGIFSERKVKEKEERKKRRKRELVLKEFRHTITSWSRTIKRNLRSKNLFSSKKKGKTSQENVVHKSIEKTRGLFAKTSFDVTEQVFSCSSNPKSEEEKERRNFREGKMR